jgi:guanylate kinase
VKRFGHAVKKGKIIVLSGPSGSGKTTLYKHLLEDRRLRGRLRKSISVTTRPRRQGERCGKDYFFVSTKMFLYKSHRGHFLEYEKVFDNYYGTPKKNVENVLRTGKNLLLCIDVRGAKIIFRKFPKAVTIFIKAPSMTILRKRLQGRGTEERDNVKIRLKSAREELKEAKFYNYVIVNDDLVQAYDQLEKIIESEIN